MDELRTMLDYSSDDEARLLNSLSWQVFKRDMSLTGKTRSLPICSIFIAVLPVPIILKEVRNSIMPFLLRVNS